MLDKCIVRNVVLSAYAALMPLTALNCAPAAPQNGDEVALLLGA